MNAGTDERLVRIPADGVRMEGMLAMPAQAVGIVLFAHGSGSGRLSPRNNAVAASLRQTRLATLLLDLLSPAEDQQYRTRFDIGLLSARLQVAAAWLQQQAETVSLPLCLFGASTGAAAALRVAAQPARRVAALVSRGGRPDLAGDAVLQQVRTPSLLIVGGLDEVVIDLNQRAYAALDCEKQLVNVPGAGHLFEEPGKLDKVALLARDWFLRHLNGGGASSGAPPSDMKRREQ